MTTAAAESHAEAEIVATAKPARDTSHSKGKTLIDTEALARIAVASVRVLGGLFLSIGLSVMAWAVSEITKNQEAQRSFEVRLATMEANRFTATNALEAKILTDREHAILHERVTKLEGTVASNYAEISSTMKEVLRRQDKIDAQLEKLVGGK